LRYAASGLLLREEEVIGLDTIFEMLFELSEKEPQLVTQTRLPRTIHIGVRYRILSPLA
jgi:hypothetical protein